MTGRLAGVVLAGGASRRMGRDKATLTVAGRFDGRTLIEHLASVVAQRCDPVFVVAAQGQDLPELPARVLRDEVPGLGPLPAVGLGLRAAARAGADRAFVCAVDMPSLTPALIGLLAGSHRAADVVLPRAGRDHYLAAVYRTELAGTIDALVAGGERRMGALVDMVAVQRIELDDPAPLVNLNSPDDIAGLC
ncbi:molybdenum cofactor guanylyltransferase [Mycolicibacter senuensis]|uniref:Probable molybdenum cofactor guanylyltransferase n=1 Tax=Mycolicibacter senuensis TaxID=386913 RepID=A0A7I9XL63_9MYCO|nr:molybdenum cofactor guanylyltransferase [Mycolicibacter senuensis]ORW67844.1 molybdopterin-guanine dinucleotide biosynthesis protein A [Mycolicibacter senuensis]GFG70137.1 putative molybdenum cofactor guanylyltransferase [Mycolicibacter senuensis]